ncbi:MAG: hypothetical protein IKC61_03915, partial [Clostridia bacterium]|nr:hypothetical protein [Clostridia bacterium]
LKGGELSVKYSGITGATVCDSKGNAVDFTMAGKDIITFNTVAGETYYVWNFTVNHAPEKVSGLTLSSEVLGPTAISWSGSSDAVAYNVYVAKDSAPDYTLLTTTANTSFVYNPNGFENVRMTFAVTAVGRDGSESDRALAYRNPDDLSSPVLDLSANVVDGELQVAVKTTEYSQKYRLYSKAKAADVWTLVSENDYPIIIESNYVKSNMYGVSVVNRFGDESEIVKIGVYNVSSETVDYNSANILENVKFTATADGKLYQHSSSTYGDYGKLTDGDFSTSTGRFSTKQTANDVLEGIATLPATFLLGELKIYDFNAWFSSANNMGQHIKIDVYADGKWTTAKEITSTEEILKLRKSDANGTHIVIDLSLTKAQIVKIRMDTPVSGNSISINEIQLTGVCIDSTALEERANAFDGYVFSATDPTAGTEWKKYEYITDGKTGWADPGRFATVSGKPADGTLDFEGKVFVLETLDVEYTSADLSGRDFTVYALRNGVWTEVVSKVYDEGVAKITFELGGVEAEKVRFYVSGQRSTANYIGISEMKCTGYEVIGAKVATDNILLGTSADQITIEGATLHASVPHVEYAFDGDYSRTSRYAVADRANSEGKYEYSLTIELDNVYQLYGMSFYPYYYDDGGVTRSNDTKIEVYYNGVWTTVVEGLVIEASECTDTYLNGAIASKIRITFKNTNGLNKNVSLREIECVGIAYGGEGSKENLESNVLANRTDDQLVLGNGTVHPGAGPLTSAFDGDYTTKTSRFAISGAPAYFTLEIALDNPAPLYTLAICPFVENGETVSRSNNTKVEVYIDGVWITVVAGLEIAPSKTPTTASLGGVIAEKIRITFANKTGTTNASIYEISCTTGAVDAINRKPLLDAYIALDNTVVNGLGEEEIKKAKLDEAKALLMDTKADKDTISSYVAVINAKTEEVKAGFATTDRGDFFNYDLELSDEIGIRVYGRFESLSADSYVVVRFTDGKVVRIPASELVIGADGRYVLTVNSLTACVNDDITVAVVFDADSCTNQSVISVKRYADKILSNSLYEDFYPGISELARAILNFEYNTELQSAVLPEISLVKSYHDYTGEAQRHPALAPTYTAPGYVEFYTCVGCEKLYVKNGDEFVEVTADDIVLPKLVCSEHNFVDGNCTICGEHECKGGTATCNSKAICSVCGKEYGDFAAHTPEVVPGKDATCTEAGLTEGEKCSVCGTVTVEQSTIPALGHTEEAVPGKDATCTEAGLTEGKKCTVCGTVTVEQSTIPALGHTDAEPKDYICDVCEADLCTVHVEEIIPGKAATCTETGLTEGKRCSNCGEITVPQTEIPALGHTEGTPVKENNVDPTCTDKGGYDTVTYCTVCGTELSRIHTELDALGHTAGTPVKENNFDPTCTDKGGYDTVIYCTVCGTELGRTHTELDALGHTAGTPVKENNVDPTCTDKGGYDTVTYCTVCKVETSRVHTELDALGHDWADATTEAPKTCKVCGETEGEKLPTDTPETEPDTDTPVVENHDECKASNFFEEILMIIINFFRELAGLPKQCYCGAEL